MVRRKNIHIFTSIIIVIFQTFICLQKSRFASPKINQKTQVRLGGFSPPIYFKQHMMSPTGNSSPKFPDECLKATTGPFLDEIPNTKNRTPVFSEMDASFGHGIAFVNVLIGSSHSICTAAVRLGLIFDLRQGSELLRGKTWVFPQCTGH